MLLSYLLAYLYNNNNNDDDDYYYYCYSSQVKSSQKSSQTSIYIARAKPLMRCMYARTLLILNIFTFKIVIPQILSVKSHTVGSNWMSSRTLYRTVCSISRAYRFFLFQFYLAYQLILTYHTHCDIQLYIIIMPPPLGQRALGDDARLTSVCLSRTSGISRKQRGLGRLPLAQRWPTSHVTPTPLSRSKGQRSTCRGRGIGGLPYSLLYRRRLARLVVAVGYHTQGGPVYCGGHLRRRYSMVYLCRVRLGLVRQSKLSTRHLRASDVKDTQVCVTYVRASSSSSRQL